MKKVILASLLGLSGCVEVKNTYPRYAPSTIRVGIGDVTVGFSGNMFAVRNITTVNGGAILLGSAYGYKSPFYTSTAIYNGYAETSLCAPAEAKIIVDQMEARGLITRSSTPKYIVDVDGKYIDGKPPEEVSFEDAMAVYLPTLTFAGRSEHNYKYRLKIYDAKSGKVLHLQDFNINGYIITAHLVPLIYLKMFPGQEYHDQWAYMISDVAVDAICKIEKQMKENKQ